MLPCGKKSCRNCSGIFVCSNSQPLDPYHHTCFVEFWCHFASYLPFGKTLISKWKYNLMLQIHSTKCSNLTVISPAFLLHIAPRLRHQGIAADNMMEFEVSSVKINSHVQPILHLDIFFLLCSYYIGIKSW